jgi:hypothetical protein
MGTKLKVVLCDEHGIGGSGKYFGDNDGHHDIINVFYHEASGGKYLPRAVLFNLEPGVIDAVHSFKSTQPRRQNPELNVQPRRKSAGSLLGCDLCYKPRAPHRGKSLGPFVCGANTFIPGTKAADDSLCQRRRANQQTLLKRILLCCKPILAPGLMIKDAHYSGWLLGHFRIPDPRRF